MRHIIKKKVPPRRVKDLTVILLSAGIESRAKGQGSPCLFDVGGVRLLDYQIDVINQIFQKCRIIPVLGFQSNKIISTIHNTIPIVENQIYQETNSSESLRLGLNNTVDNNILVIHGNMIFHQDFFEGIDFNKPFVLYKNLDVENEKVGITENGSILENMYYGLNKQWCNILYTTNNATKKLRQILAKEKYTTKVLFETINDLLKTERIRAYDQTKTIIEINNYRSQKNEIDYIIKNA